MEASTCRNGEGTPESTALSLQEATSLSKGASSGETTLLGQNNGAKENDHSTKPDDTKCAEPMSPVQLSTWRYDRQPMYVLLRVIVILSLNLFIARTFKRILRGSPL